MAVLVEEGGERMSRSRASTSSVSRRLAGAGLVLMFGAGATAQPDPVPAIPNLAGKILTVKGPIDPAQAGPTLMHEHIFIEFKAPNTAGGAGVTDDDRQPPPGASAQGQGAAVGRATGWNVLDNFDEQLAEVMAFARAGGGTIVDTTNFGLTRKPEWLKRMSDASGLHVVMGAGWYMRTLHPPDMDVRTVEELTDIVVRDVTVGAQGTNIRSGIIGEVGVGVFGPPAPLTENERKSVRASARASRITGAPMTLHSFAPADEMQRVLDIIASEGVDLTRVVMGHTGTGDLAAMKRYTDRGAYIEFDYIGGGKGPDSGPALAQAAGRLATSIKTLIDGGLTDRILVAHDVCTRPQLKRNGGGGFDYISTAVMPALRAKGVSEETIRTILVDNPRRVLTFVAPQAVVSRPTLGVEW